MRGFGRLSLLLGAIVTGSVLAQVTLPRIVQLPTSDFIWNWGREPSIDRQERPDFDIFGTEQEFRCTLTGSFQPGSRMRDFENLREFEHMLNTTLYFIQDSVDVLNAYYNANEIRWATLDCAIPEVTEADAEKTQERLDRALERAERERERRRRREQDDD